MKILILRFSSIGDIVLTTPVIRNVKMQLNARVHYATKKQFGNILEGNPYIDRVHVLDDSVMALVAELRKEKFDYIIDLHNNFRTRIIKTLLWVKSGSVNKLNIEKWLMVNFKINVLPAEHIVDRYLEAAAELGLKNDAAGLDYFIPEKDEVHMNELPLSHQGGYIVYVMGGLHNTKKLPVQRMKELCLKINRPIVLLGGKEDAETGEEINLFFSKYNSGSNQGRTIIYNGCGKYNLNQSASILKNASHVFAHDTGLMHIAAALKKEIFSIWGNTIPAFGMYPYRTPFTALENNHLSCRPCSKIGYAKCPKGHFKCMNDIVFDFKV